MKSTKAHPVPDQAFEVEKIYSRFKSIERYLKIQVSIFLINENTYEKIIG